MHSTLELLRLGRSEKLRRGNSFDITSLLYAVRFLHFIFIVARAITRISEFTALVKEDDGPSAKKPRASSPTIVR